MMRAKHQSTCIAACLLAIAGSTVTVADAESGVDVTIVDRDGAPIPEVAIYAVAVKGEVDDKTIDRSPINDSRARIDQKDRAFVPHVLVVETGTEIEFPNSDEILHHVYSFSSAKRFELSLYAGTTHEPLTFDRPGLVTLGCNIHDSMLGYILVVDTPYFALSDGQGQVRLDGLPDGKYSLEIWTPRLRPDRLPAPIHVRISDGSAQAIELAISDKLYPPHADSETSLVWDAY